MTFRNHSFFSSLIALCTILAGMLSSCGGSKVNSTDYLYFQNGAEIVATQQKETVIQPKDMLSIQVYSKTLNQEQAVIFNIPVTGAAAAAGATQGYQVSSAGTIDMPVIGSVLAAGLTKDQLQALLIEKLTNGAYVKNPAVMIRFLNFSINMLGEVGSPGTKTFATDRVTIIDALSAAGDLTPEGRRDDVTVIREHEGKKIFYYVDLRDKSVFQSPVYNLQPNDIVYVRPNNFKLKALSVDPEVQRRTGLFTTALGIVITLTTLVFTVFR